MWPDNLFLTRKKARDADGLQNSRTFVYVWIARKLLIVLLLVGVRALLNCVFGINVAKAAIKLTIESAIGTKTYDYVGRALAKASQQGAEMIIIRMDTPRDRNTIMRGIIKNNANSLIPTVTYVAPTGAYAASAIRTY